GEIPRAIVKKLAMTDVLLKTEVEKIVRKGEKFELSFDNGSTGLYDSLIVASPSYSASKIVREMAPEISDELSHIPYVSTATVSLAYLKSDLPAVPEGFGFLVPKITARKIMAATYTSLKFSERATEDKLLIRVFVGGAANENLVFQNDGEMLDMVKKELKEIVGIGAEPELSKVYRWEKAMPQYVVGHLDRVSRIEEKATQYPGLFFAGSAYRGIGISDCIVAADKAAERVFDFISD
ncbi:MAG: protoporphyrinogen oxidase, partial [Nitrospinota bacterium]